MRHLYTRVLAGILTLAGLAGAPALSAQTLTHVYTLDGVFTDALGGPSLTGNGGTFGPTGLNFGLNEGPSLSGGLSDIGVYSAETLFSLAITGGWRKILDFKDRSTDRGLYNNSGLLVQFPVIGSSPVFATDVLAHLVVTRDAGNLFTAYVDGTLAFSFNDIAGDTRFTGPSGIMHFFRDDLNTGGEASGGYADYIRIYDGAMSAEQVGARYANRGDQLEGVSQEVVTPEPVTLLLLGSGLGAVGAVRRRRAQR